MLITLVIIGVIAALTIPNLMHNYKTKELKTGFLKCYRNISEVTKLMTSDLGVSSLADVYTVYEPEKGGYYKTREFINECIKYFKVVKNIPYGNNAENNSFGYKNYTGNYTFKYNDNDAGGPYSGVTTGIYILPDGSSMIIKIVGGMIMFTIDTNGPYKRPNRLGYDVFTFQIEPRNPSLQFRKQIKLYTPEELETVSYPFAAGRPCSEHSSQEYNGVGCSWYAFHDINPDDSSKPYWKSLKW